MRFLKGLLLVSFLVVIFSLGIVWYFVQQNSLAIAQTVLIKSFNQPVTIERITYRFPRGLSFHHISIGEDFKIKKAVADFDIKYLLKGNVIVNRLMIVEPVLEVSQISESYNVSANRLLLAEHTQKKITDIDIFITDVSVTNGIVRQQMRILDNEYFIRLSDVNISARKIKFPLRTMQTTFSLESDLSVDGLDGIDGKLFGVGWIDFSQKDLDANLSLMTEPSSEILKVNLSAQQNELTVNGQFLRQLNLSQANLQPTRIEKILSKGLSSSQVDFNTEFSFQTQLDHPRLEKILFKGSLTVEE